MAVVKGFVFKINPIVHVVLNSFIFVTALFCQTFKTRSFDICRGAISNSTGCIACETNQAFHHTCMHDIIHNLVVVKYLIESILITVILCGVMCSSAPQ